MEAIALDAVSKSFGEKRVLDNISFSVRKGEIFGLLGPSGAGKTTMIKILTGQLKADGGSSCINDKNSQELKPSDYSGFGIMMDDFGVYERLSCFQNLKIFARIYGLSNENIYKALGEAGLSSDAKTPAGKLSKGMKSRLQLARVFMINPSILFLDEPTNGLDPVTAKDIQRIIIKQKNKGKTVFLTTHNMSEAEKLCDNIALLNDGSIVEYGNPKEICRRYNHTKTIKVHLTDGSELVIPHDENSADIIGEILRSGAAETIHTTEPNLETVFIELTGKELSQ